MKADAIGLQFEHIENLRTWVIWIAEGQLSTLQEIAVLENGFHLIALPPIYLAHHELVRPHGVSIICG